MGWLPVEGSLVPMCQLTVGEDLCAAVGEGERLSTELVLDSAALTAPVAQGEPVGELIVSLQGRELSRVPVVTAQAIPCDLDEHRTIIEKILARLAVL